jgi:hypothetical protein
MKVIVDTSVWSLALRRNSKVENLPQIQSFRELIRDGRYMRESGKTTLKPKNAIKRETLYTVFHTFNFTPRMA